MIGGRLSDYDFDLPEELIALRPARPRRAARMLVATHDTLSDRRVSDLATILRPSDLLVFNNTKVIPAQLSGRRRRDTPHGSGEARVQVQLLAPLASGAWRALARPAKRLAPGDRIEFAPELAADVVGKGQRGEVTLAFESGAPLDHALEAHGAMPLPPYIARRRPPDARDREDYQPIFAQIAGAVAAPTASLHFDEALLSDLAHTGIEHVEVTLHVGAGTFLPVKTDLLSNHKMHAERGDVTPAAAEVIRSAKAEGRRVIAVGTTALRLLETAAADGAMEAFSGETDLFVTPGHQFRATDGLLTNFHLPKSTLLMLVAALMGHARVREIYDHAIRERYRFFSYGDASLLLP
ncbi:MAG: tRNA preQ1(34) S-adenosylmethionine ribosyltransferase-isomerase QueA [Pseudomonadota bacterium]